MIEKFKELKSIGAYAINLTYGGDVGCDDSDVPAKERELKVIFYPVGCLGTCKVLYIGTYEKFLKFNLRTKPTIVSNPPGRKDVREHGYYIWGTEDGVKSSLKLFENGQSKLTEHEGGKE